MPKKPKKYELTFKDLALIGSTVHKEFDGAPHGGGAAATGDRAGGHEHQRGRQQEDEQRGTQRAAVNWRDKRS